MRKNKNPVKLGRSFEDRVRRAFERNYFVLREQNKWMKNHSRSRDPAARREYDLEMVNLLNFQPYIIECKAHYADNQDKLVGMTQIKEFVDKLNKYNGRYAKRIMVTDTDFTFRAINYAKQNSIDLINGEELRAFEMNGGGLVAKMVSKGASAGLKVFHAYVKKGIKKCLT